MNGQKGPLFFFPLKVGYQGNRGKKKKKKRKREVNRKLVPPFPLH